MKLALSLQLEIEQLLPLKAAFSLETVEANMSLPPLVHVLGPIGALVKEVECAER